MRTIMIGITAAAVACGSTGPQGVQGPKGDKGDPGASSAALASISPHRAVLDRELDVAIAGSNTTFDGSTTASFGAGVSVTKMTLVSPASLLAHVVVDKNASLGARDVVVTTAGIPLTATSGFDVSAAMDVTISQGTPQQAGIAVASVHDNDTALYFDSGYWTGGLQGSISLARLFALGGSASSLHLLDVSPTDATAVILFDPLAKPSGGLVGYNLDSIDGVTPVASFLGDPAALTIAPRTPKTLSNQALVQDAITAPLGTLFYKASTSGPAIVMMSFAAAPNSSASPISWAYPASGAFADLLTRQMPFAVPAATATDFYTVIADIYLRGAPGGYGVNGAATILPATLDVEASAPHGDIGSAQLLSPANFTNLVVVTGSLSTSSEVDVYTVGTWSGVASSLVFSLTASGVQATLVDALYNPVVSLQPRLPEHNANAQFTLGLGTYYVVVSAQAGATGAPGAYTFAVGSLPPS